MESRDCEKEKFVFMATVSLITAQSEEVEQIQICQTKHQFICEYQVA